MPLTGSALARSSQLAENWPIAVLCGVSTYQTTVLDHAHALTGLTRPQSLDGPKAARSRRSPEFPTNSCVPPTLFAAKIHLPSGDFPGFDDTRCCEDNPFGTGRPVLVHTSLPYLPIAVVKIWVRNI
jgi:hypothetical protein